MVALIAVLSLAQAQPWKPAELPRGDADGFVLVRGGTFHAGDAAARKGAGGPLVRVEDFELCDHPVTNAEYRRFVDATGHAAPLHWEQGGIPRGMERHPVVFVHRKDVDAYVAWRTKAEGRHHRLPTDAEFEYAARGGLEGKLYPWGDGEPLGRANFDPTGGRLFDAWRSHLKPVKSFEPNGYGLYDTAGHVWQMVLVNTDPSRVRFKYRITTQTDLEARVVGGSWARNATFLRCGNGGTASGGIRQPDLGFRVAREPERGSPAFNTVVRRVVALPAAGKIFLGWQLLPEDGPGTAFNVYRAHRRDSAGFLINPAPLRGGACYEDADVREGTLYSYRVRPVAPDGKEGASSEWVTVEAGPDAGGRVKTFLAAPRKTGGAPGFGDLNGDGHLDVVLRLDNGIVEMSKDPGVPVELEAYLSTGLFLWRRALVRHENCFGSANDVPVNVYDLDGDGKAEIVCRLEEEGKVCLAVLEGMSGRVLRKTPWPEMLTDFSRSSTRIHLSVAYLDGRNPAIVTQTGLYENEVFTAYDAGLRKLWEWKSLAETNGSGSHRIEVADVNGDGKDEVFDGTTCLNGDGTVRWSLYREHPDVVSIKDLLPDRPGLEVFYAVESNRHAGAYVVDADTGKVIWKVNREDDPRWTHAHTGWVADVWADSPGLEAYTNRDGHFVKDTVLLSASGKVLLEPFPRELLPVEWDGDGVRELITGAGKIGKFDGRGVVPLAGGGPAGMDRRVVMVADLWGDFRDEIVTSGRDAEGNFGVSVFTATTPISSRAVTRTARRGYRTWMAHNLVGGYGQYYEPE